MARNVFMIEVTRDSPSTNDFSHLTFSLPASRDRIWEDIQEAHSAHREDLLYSISIRKCSCVPCLEGARLDNPTTDELNFLFKRFDSMQACSISPGMGLYRQVRGGRKDRGDPERWACAKEPVQQ